VGLRNGEHPGHNGKVKVYQTGKWGQAKGSVFSKREKEGKGGKEPSGLLWGGIMIGTLKTQ